jgi:hypothetical protein
MKVSASGLLEHCTNTMIVLFNGSKTLEGGQGCIEEHHIWLVYNKTASTFPSHLGESRDVYDDVHYLAL